VRVAPNHISVSDKEAIQVVYSQGTAAFDKSPFYAAFIGSRASIFSTMDRQEHAHKRRLLSNAFAYRSVVSFEPLLQDRLQKLVDKFDGLCKTGQVFDALLWFNYLAFDILSLLAFGEAIGMVDNVRLSLHSLPKTRDSPLFTIQGSDTVSVERPDGTVVTDEHAITLVDEVNPNILSSSQQSTNAFNSANTLLPSWVTTPPIAS
jgi:benzoate 4-monooxygenase